MTYKMTTINIVIIDNAQLIELENAYPDGEIIIDKGNRYYKLINVEIADLPEKSSSEEMEDTDNVVLRDLIYSGYLLSRGYEKLSEYGTTISFEGIVDPNITFKYKKDYFLGDKVSVKNEFGISAEARIVEVVEVFDENGYSIEPKFEYKNKNDIKWEDTTNVIAAESGKLLLTENEEMLEV